MIVVTPAALAQWRSLRRQGLASGHLQRRAGNLIPAKGATGRVYVRARRDDGRIFDPAGRWTAQFVKRRSPGQPTAWVVESVEAIR